MNIDMHPDDAELSRAVANITARLPRLEKAAADAKAAYNDATLAAAALAGQEARRAARTEAAALRMRVIDKEMELASETGARDTALQRLADQRQARADVEQAELEEAERRAAGATVQALYDKLSEIDAAVETLGVLRAELVPLPAAVFALTPAKLRAEVAPWLVPAQITNMLKLAMFDRMILPGMGSNLGDRTSPRAKLTWIFDRCEELRSLLPEREEAEA